MGLLGSGDITIIDITDNRPVTLTLSTSLSKTQVESEGSYQPDYSLNSQVITPSLYFGSEIFEGEYEVSYTINGEKIDKYDDKVSQEGNNLKIVANLTEASYFITATVEGSITDTVTNTTYENIQAQLELIKLYNAKENFLPIIEYTRDAFNDKENGVITLTAILYKGGVEYNSGLSYKWTSTSSFDENNNPEVLGDKNYLIVDREKVDNITTFICEITVEKQNKSYAARVTLRDWTDPLSSEIISSQGIYIPTIEGNLELNCRIFKGAEEISSENYAKFSYSWSYLLESSTKPSVISGEENKTLIISPQNISGLNSPQYVTFYCTATKSEEKTSSQITVLFSPEFKVSLTPRNIFIPVNKNGSFRGEETVKSLSWDFILRLEDKNGQSLVFNNNNKDTFNPSSTEDYITIETPSQQETEKWDFSFKITCNTANISNLDESTLINISYKYFGVEETEEIYLIKNFQGETGEQGEKGSNGLEVDKIHYGISEDGTSADSVTKWDEKIPGLTDNKGKFLWVKYTYEGGGEFAYPIYIDNSGNMNAISIIYANKNVKSEYVNISFSPTGRDYIGIKTANSSDKLNAWTEESGNPEGYSWFLYKKDSVNQNLLPFTKSFTTKAETDTFFEESFLEEKKYWNYTNCNIEEEDDEGFKTLKCDLSGFEIISPTFKFPESSSEYSYFLSWEERIQGEQTYSLKKKGFSFKISPELENLEFYFKIKKENEQGLFFHLYEKINISTDENEEEKPKFNLSFSISSFSIEGKQWGFLKKFKLEYGLRITEWTDSSDDSDAQLNLKNFIDLTVQNQKTNIENLFSENNEIITNKFDKLTGDLNDFSDKLSNQNDSFNGEIEKIITVTNRINYGTEKGIPFLEISTKEKIGDGFFEIEKGSWMRLTNDKLIFMGKELNQDEEELAFFDTKKLWVRRVEAIEELALGSEELGGFLSWRILPSKGISLGWRKE